MSFCILNWEFWKELGQEANPQTGKCEATVLPSERLYPPEWDQPLLLGWQMLASTLSQINLLWCILSKWNKTTEQEWIGLEMIRAFNFWKKTTVGLKPHDNGVSTCMIKMQLS